MAKKLSAAELRAEAELMLKKAQEIEDQVAIKLGRLVLGYHGKGFKGFDLEVFRGEVIGITK